MSGCKHMNPANVCGSCRPQPTARDREEAATLCYYECDSDHGPDCESCAAIARTIAEAFARGVESERKRGMAELESLLHRASQLCPTCNGDISIRDVDEAITRLAAPKGEPAEKPHNAPRKP